LNVIEKFGSELSNECLQQCNMSLNNFLLSWQPLESKSHTIYPCIIFIFFIILALEKFTAYTLPTILTAIVNTGHCHRGIKWVVPL
uniref:Odorant receptor n=1 Tax=Brugia timori TaxID=42155 RepID=A0A0R3QEM1_9BILA